jgi:tripartite-type tricarboxylate transporter receptor subunit TctC
MTPTRSSRRQFITQAAALTGAAALGPARASDPAFPSRPVRLVAPSPAGGVIDAGLRVLAPKWQARLGQPVLVNNLPGASGGIAMNTLRSAEPDGHTLMAAHASMLSAQLLLKHFDLLTQTQPVALLGSAYYSLVVPQASALRSAEDLLTVARQRPGQFNYASTGTGSLEHLLTAAVANAAGIQALHVPYKGGPDMVQALLSGQAQFALIATALVLPHIQTRRLRVLGSLSPQRQAVLPDTPTLVGELKLPFQPFQAWSAVCVPASTPPAVVQRLHADMRALMMDAEVQQHWRTSGLDLPVEASPEQIRQLMAADREWMQQVITANGITV